MYLCVDRYRFLVYEAINRINNKVFINDVFIFIFLVPCFFFFFLNLETFTKEKSGIKLIWNKTAECVALSKRRHNLTTNGEVPQPAWLTVISLTKLPYHSNFTKSVVLSFLMGFGIFIREKRDKKKEKKKRNKNGLSNKFSTLCLV